jgi:hypothetical protein
MVFICIAQIIKIHENYIVIFLEFLSISGCQQCSRLVCLYFMFCQTRNNRKFPAFECILGRKSQ